MLSDLQVETFIYGFRKDIANLQAQQFAQNAILNQLQTTLNSLSAQASTLSNVPIVSSGSDSYPVAGGILHKLSHIFSINVLIKGILSLTNALAVTMGGTGATTASGARTNLSAAKSGANSDITSLTGLSTPLPLSEGGVQATTATGARSTISAAALPQTIAGSNFQYPGQASTACAGSQSVTINGSNFIAPIGGGACTGSQTFTILGSNFTFTVIAVNNTGTQPLV